MDIAIPCNIATLKVSTVGKPDVPNASNNTKDESLKGKYEVCIDGDNSKFGLPDPVNKYTHEDYPNAPDDQPDSIIVYANGTCKYVAVYGFTMFCMQAVAACVFHGGGKSPDNCSADSPPRQHFMFNGT